MTNILLRRYVLDDENLFSSDGRLKSSSTSSFKRVFAIKKDSGIKYTSDNYCYSIPIWKLTILNFKNYNLAVDNAQEILNFEIDKTEENNKNLQSLLDYFEECTNGKQKDFVVINSILIRTYNFHPDDIHSKSPTGLYINMFVSDKHAKNVTWNKEYFFTNWRSDPFLDMYHFLKFTTGKTYDVRFPSTVNFGGISNYANPKGKQLRIDEFKSIDYILMCFVEVLYNLPDLLPKFFKYHILKELVNEVKSWAEFMGSKRINKDKLHYTMNDYNTDIGIYLYEKISNFISKKEALGVNPFNFMYFRVKRLNGIIELKDFPRISNTAKEFSCQNYHRPFSYIVYNKSPKAWWKLKTETGVTKTSKNAFIMLDLFYRTVLAMRYVETVASESIGYPKLNKWIMREIGLARSYAKYQKENIKSVIWIKKNIDTKETSSQVYTKFMEWLDGSYKLLSSSYGLTELIYGIGVSLDEAGELASYYKIEM